MAKFRKQPVEIEAVQWGPPFCEPAPDWVTEALADGRLYRFGDMLKVRTLEGAMNARPGDWIIRGVAGELYPCKPGIFEQTYEPVK